MKNIIVSKRYAEAYLGYASSRIGRLKALQELLDLRRLLRENAGFMQFMESIQVTEQEKCDLIDTVLSKGFSEELRDLIKFLLRKKRINIFPDIVEYARIKYSHGTEVGAQLKTSYPLDTDVLQKIKSALEARFKEKLHMYVELDSDLLGGIYVRIKNTVIDASVKRRLSDLREKLTVLKVT